MQIGNNFTDHLISVEDITLQLGHHQAFIHTTFSIAKNEHWGILGPSGSGKSILVKALCRKISLVHGQILYHFDEVPRSYLYPHEVLTLSAETHRSFLRQYAGYHQARWQSFEGDEAPSVALLLEPQTGSTDHQLIREYAIDLFQLKPLLDRKVIHLSFGESRKVFISRLLIQSSHLLILDDPYDGLDQDSRKVFSLALDKIIKDGSQQILMVSSHPSEIPSGIDHFLLVNNLSVTSQGVRMANVIPDIVRELSDNKPIEKDGFKPGNAFQECVQEYTAAYAKDLVKINQPLIQMEHVSVNYGDVTVLNNISWSVNMGQRWALLGHNGAGKSTLLSLILADNPQSYKNEITMFGKKRGSGESIWEIKHNFGWISSELQIFYQDNDISLNVVCSGFFDSIGLSRKPSNQQLASAKKWLEAFGVGELAFRSFNTLSSGQQRLILLARAMVKNPPVLILDEPYQALDENHRTYFTQLLANICDRTPITLIYVTHYQDQLPSFITHILRLANGAVIQQSEC